MQPIERALAGLVKQDDGCWLWQGCTSGGYGVLNVDQRNVQVHRVIAEHYHGPSELPALHKCDNKLCGNPEHLEYGTQGRNIRDARDRLENVGSQKLSRYQAWLIRFHETGPLEPIAQKYGIKVAQVSLIQSGKRWADLTPHEFSINQQKV